MTTLKNDSASTSTAHSTNAHTAAPRPGSTACKKKRRESPWKAMGLGIALFIVFIGIWQAVAAAGWLSDIAPTPARTWDRAVEILSDPFYRDGPASVGIFWHMVASLRRVLIGFVIAMVIAIPLGFWLGSSATFRRATDPFVQILRPVSPLAWLPLGLALLRDAEKYRCLRHHPLRLVADAAQYHRGRPRDSPHV